MTDERSGLVNRLGFCKQIGVCSRTVDLWIHRGVNGIRLPSSYIGGRVFVTWEDWREWQEKIRTKRLGVKPRKSSTKAREVLEQCGYF